MYKLYRVEIFRRYSLTEFRRLRQLLRETIHFQVYSLSANSKIVCTLNAQCKTMM